VALTFRKEAPAGEPIPSPDLVKLLSLYPAFAAMQAAGLSGTAPLKPPGPTPSANEAAPKTENKTVDVRMSEETGSKKEKYRLYEGTVLETVLTNRLDGSFSGPVNCMLTTNVYSRDGQHLLIPQGSRILGEARKVEAFGQNRLAVYFHRLIMPDGSWITLDKFQGLNQIGESGLDGQINHHYFQVFGVSIAIGAIAGLGQANTRTGLDQSGLDAYQQGVTTSLSQSSLRILDRYLNVLPTITIREGARVKVLLSADLLLPAYEDSNHF
jgi:type IV secretion system protein VirB10